VRVVVIYQNLPGSTMTGNGDDIKDLRKFHFKLKGAKNNV
jgi:hypothetical protein